MDTPNLLIKKSRTAYRRLVQWRVLWLIEHSTSHQLLCKTELLRFDFRHIAKPRTGVHKLKTELKLIKKTLIGILLLGIIAIIGYVVFMANFEIFDEPTETELKVECDYEGLRKIKMTEMTGNATLNRSIHIYATDCNYDENIKPEPIFVASAGFIKPKDVSFEWKSFDTLTIKYNKKLKIFKQKTESESVNPKIIFEDITE